MTGTGQAPPLRRIGCYQWSMRRKVTALAALSLALTGCGSAPVASPPTPPVSTTNAPAASPASSAPPLTPPPTTATPTPAATSRSANPNPPAPPSNKVRDCFDGDCTLLLSRPTTIPLDAKKFYYSSLRVTAISADSLSFSVADAHGGDSEVSIGPGLGGLSFGFGDSPSLEVGLTTVDGKPALVLQPGAIT